MRLELSADILSMLERHRNAASLSPSDASEVLTAAGAPSVQLFRDILCTLHSVRVEGKFLTLAMVPEFDRNQPTMGTEYFIEEPTSYANTWQIDIMRTSAGGEDPFWCDTHGFIRTGTTPVLVSVNCNVFIEHVCRLTAIPKHWKGFQIRFSQINENRGFLDPIVQQLEAVEPTLDDFGGLWTTESVAVSWRSSLGIVYPWDNIEVYCNPMISTNQLDRMFAALPNARLIPLGAFS